MALVVLRLDLRKVVLVVASLVMEVMEVHIVQQHMVDQVISLAALAEQEIDVMDPQIMVAMAVAVAAN